MTILLIFTNDGVNDGVSLCLVAPFDIFKQSPKATVVIGVSENRLLLIAPADDVVKSPWEVVAARLWQLCGSFGVRQLWGQV